MTTMSGQQGSRQAKSYLTKENYYQQNSEVGYYFGKGLAAIGINIGDAVTQQNYELLLNGYDLNGKALIKNAGIKNDFEYTLIDKLKRDLKSKKTDETEVRLTILANPKMAKFYDEKKTLKENFANIKEKLEDQERRAGFDVTCSAPKSVSILMAGFETNGLNDKAVAIREAHFKANQQAMLKLQEDYTYVRVQDPDSADKSKTIMVKSNGLMYASFQHDTTRQTAENKIDMQLHNHNFIFNVVSYDDPITGKTRTVTLTNDEIYRQKMYLGIYYRSELAKELQKLGYKTELTDSLQGFFEIENARLKSAIPTFSGRTDVIEQKMEEIREKNPGMEEWKVKEIAQKEVTKAKKILDEEALKADWKFRLENVGLDKNFFESFKTSEIKVPTLDEIKKHITAAVATVIENNSVFSKELLMKELLKYGLEYGIDEETYMAAVEKRTDIVTLADNVYSTQEMILLEQNMIKKIIKSNGTQKPILDDEIKINQAIANFELLKKAKMTDGQKIMTRTILNTKNMVTAVQGDAGTGKTFSMASVQEIMAKNFPKTEVIGLSFTGKAARGLENDSQIKSQTVHSFLFNEEKKGATSKNRVIIIDEAGTIGSVQVSKLIGVAEKNGDKLVFVGDTKQFQSISAGTAFADMQKYATDTIFLDETMRQESLHGKGIVKAIKERDPVLAFEILEQQHAVFELEKDEAISKIVEQYINSDMNDTIILTSKNADKNEINKKIRSALKIESLATGGKYKTLEAKSLTGIAAKRTDNYKIGEIINVSKMEGFKQGEKLIITGVYDDKTLIVQAYGSKNGKKRSLNIEKEDGNFSLYVEKEKDLREGDKIIFNKKVHDKKTGFRVDNGDIDTIQNIDKEGNITTKGGKKFNINTMPYLDYGYGITDYKSQGMTAKNAIVYADSRSSNYNSFYVQATRVKLNLTVFTDNLKKLKENIVKFQDKESTLKYTQKDTQNGKDAATNIKTTTGHDEQSARARKTTSEHLWNIIENVRTIARAIGINSFIKQDYSAVRRGIKDQYLDRADNLNKIFKKVPEIEIFKALGISNIEKIGQENIMNYLTRTLGMTQKIAEKNLNNIYNNFIMSELRDSTALIKTTKEVEESITKKEIEAEYHAEIINSEKYKAVNANREAIANPKPKELKEAGAGLKDLIEQDKAKKQQQQELQ